MFYNVVKVGVNLLIKLFVVEWVRKGVWVNVVVFGYVVIELMLCG